MNSTSNRSPWLKTRLQEIKRQAATTILPKSDHVGELYIATIAAFGSYVVGRTILEFCKEIALNPDDSRILIVGAYGGRDYHWLTGFGYRVDILDLGHHPWGKTDYVGDACNEDTWSAIPVKYNLVVMCEVLEHLPEDFAALKYARRVLAKGGHLYLSVPYTHDIEPTHVRAYSLKTLPRLLTLAGYEPIWRRERPGNLEVSVVTPIVNYTVALLMPSPKLGGRVLHSLLQMEYLINERTRWWYARFGRSPAKGVAMGARILADSSPNYVSMNHDTFIGEGE